LGPLGFIFGLGKGIVGFVTKPIVGVMDFVQDISEGLRASSNPNRVYPTKERLPRYIGADLVLEEFKEEKATASEKLHTADRNQYIQHMYIAHICKFKILKPAVNLI
jgi:vacuolar protein sorting-associated protein 13A/C